MAESESPFPKGGPDVVGHPVIQAGKTAVGMLRSAWDDDVKFSKKGVTTLLKDLGVPELTHLAMVQTVWLLEQMEWIANVELPEGDTLSVDDQIACLGIDIALGER